MNTKNKIKKAGQRGILFALLFLLSGCSCCLYFNHFYNVKKYYRRGYNMMEARKDSIPDDTLWVAESEIKNWDKVIHTGSLILDRWSDDRDYKADVLVRMGDAYFFKGKWKEAITKYDELERYFPNDPQMRRAEYHRIWALHKSGENALAAYQAKTLLTNMPEHPYKESIQEIYALTFTGDNQGDQAIEILEKLLATPGEPGLLRARVRLQLADLYFAKDNFGKALDLYKHKSVDFLSLAKKHYSLRQAALCHFKLKEIDKAIAFIIPLSQPPYDSFAIETLLEEGRYRLTSSEPEKGLEILDSVTTLSKGTEIASHAYWLMADFKDRKLQKYDEALELYRLSSQANGRSEWAKLSLDRMIALKKFLELRQIPDSTKSNGDRFRYAELFLYNQESADSSLAIIENLIQTPEQDSLSLLKALYTKAFILEQYLDKKAEAQSVYEQILRKYPETEFARQAELNLGREGTVKTFDDKAQIAFTNAESLYYSLDSIALIDTLTYDSLLQIALQNFDSLSLQFEGTPYAAKALYLKAWILENEQKDFVAATIAYKEVARLFPDSPYGKKAYLKTAEVNEEENKIIVREKRILEDMITNHQKRVERRQRQEERKQQEKKPTEEELLWDYNHLYDF